VDRAAHRQEVGRDLAEVGVHLQPRRVAHQVTDDQQPVGERIGRSGGDLHAPGRARRVRVPRRAVRELRRRARLQPPVVRRRAALRRQHDALAGVEGRGFRARHDAQGCSAAVGAGVSGVTLADDVAEGRGEAASVAAALVGAARSTEHASAGRIELVVGRALAAAGSGVSRLAGAHRVATRHDAASVAAAAHAGARRRHVRLAPERLGIRAVDRRISGIAALHRVADEHPPRTSDSRGPRNRARTAGNRSRRRAANTRTAPRRSRSRRSSSARRSRRSTRRRYPWRARYTRGRDPARARRCSRRGASSRRACSRIAPCRTSLPWHRRSPR
jgi:hypothetical protein